MKHVLAATCAALGALALASGAAAQARSPAAAAAPVGPVINGVCTLSLDAAVGTSTVGKFVDGRLQQISGQVRAELTGEETAIETEAKTLDTQRTSLDQNTLEQRAAALQVRQNALQRKAQLRERELQATTQKALGRIGQEMDPIIRQISAQKNCGMVVRTEALVYANPAMDITPQVVAGLNAKITQFAFDREHLDQTASAAPPVATVPTPARPAPSRR